MNHVILRITHHILIICLLIFCPSLLSQDKGGGIDSRDKAAASLIAEYRTDDPATRVRGWQREITYPSGNPKFKEYQAERIKEWESSEFAKYRLDDPHLIALVAEVIGPVLRLYRREDCFKLIVIDHPVPVAMNDGGVILMFSTGVLERATSDDDLLGHTAHEVGHDLFWRRTTQARLVIELHRTEGVGTDMTERLALNELVKIELECDAFSAVTLASMGRNPLPTARFLEAVERDYPDYVSPDLPPAAVRVKVIEGVVPAAATRADPQISAAFQRLKALLAARKHR